MPSAPQLPKRPLGTTGIEVSAIAFGAGPVPALMTAQQPSLEHRSGDSSGAVPGDVLGADLGPGGSPGGSPGDSQREAVRQALAVGINWFDTAATYGAGRSERSLGQTLDSLPGGREVHVATKVRLMADDLQDVAGAVERSLESSLGRLRRESVTLLQLHNSVTRSRGDLPTSLSVEDVLGPGGVLTALAKLRERGWAAHLGLTGLGDPTCLRQLIKTREFVALQIPFNLLNPSAAIPLPAGFQETNHGAVVEACAECGVSVFPIRVFAGGALTGAAPSAHTRSTPFFPLDLYHRDEVRAARLRDALGSWQELVAAATRFAVWYPGLTSAIIGFSDASQIHQAVAAALQGPLPPHLQTRLAETWSA